MHRPLLIALTLLAVALLLSVAIGAVTIPPATLLRILLGRLWGSDLRPDWPPAFEVILFQLRLPHVLLVALSGAALGGSGAAYQGLFRNPLADPYLIGVASGAGLGAVLAMSATQNLAAGSLYQRLGMFTIPVAAFAGALITVALVYGLAFRGRALPDTTLILAGVAVGLFASALTSFLMLRAQGEVRRALA